jgi:O-antigen/teichoic acid export membrane protein
MAKADKDPAVPNATSGAPASVARGAVTNAIWNTFSTLWGIAIAFVIAPVLIHHLGVAQYGILLIVWSVTGILGLMGFGFGEATLRYVARYLGNGDLENANRVFGATLSFYLATCGIACVGLFATSHLLVEVFNIPPDSRAVVVWLLRLAAIVFSLRVFSLAYGAIPMALHRYDISSKIGVIQAVIRSGGYVALAFAKFGILHIILWDLITQAAVLFVQGLIARRLAPGIKLLPSLSFRGLKEIVGFSIFSFLTYVFHMMHRESGKMIVGAQLGPLPVAYLGTPDNVAQRIHMVVASGSETLMPRFSANNDARVAQSLFLNGTWASLAISLILLLPLVVLLPDFLALWINPEFARESALLGQFLALSYISQGAYAPAATYFRGTGKPWLVTLVVMFAGLATMLFSLLLIPKYGAIGVGYAYLAGSVPAIGGVVHGWFHMFGRASMLSFARTIGLPVLMAAIAVGLQYWCRVQFGRLDWVGLFTLGSAFTALSAFLIFGADMLFGGAESPSRQFLLRMQDSRKIGFLMKHLRLKKAS